MANLSIIQTPTGKSALVRHGLTPEEQEREDADPTNVQSWSLMAKDLGLDGGIYTTLQFDNALELEFVAANTKAEADAHPQHWLEVAGNQEKLEERARKLEEALDHAYDDLEAAEDRYNEAVDRDANIIEALRDKVDDLEAKLPTEVDYDQVEQAWRNQAGTIRAYQTELRGLRAELSESRDQVKAQADTIGRYQYEASQRTP